jgi:hypothetical protein
MEKRQKMKIKGNWIVATLYGYILSGAVALAEPSLEDARNILATLQPQLLQLIALSPKELENTKSEFQEYYQSDIAPRLRQIGTHIKPSAIHWVDIDPSSEEPELICWTEGLSPSAWGAKEYLFIIKVPQAGTPTILKALLLDPEPTRGVEEYKYVHFTPYPNKDLGVNNSLTAVFSYLRLGASGSTFSNYEIGWDRYEETVFISQFFTLFPVAVGKVKM